MPPMRQYRVTGAVHHVSAVVDVPDEIDADSSDFDEWVATELATLMVDCVVPWDLEIYEVEAIDAPGGVA